MKAHTQIKSDRTIVRVRFGWKEEVNKREIDFLSSNTILGLLTFKQRRKKLFEYSGVKSVSLKKYLEGSVTKKDFLLFIAQVNAIYRKVKQFNLFPKNVYLDFNCIFVNPNTKELSFVYLPVASSPTGSDYMGFLSNMVNTAKPAQEQNTDYISQFAFFLRNLEAYDPTRIDDFILTQDRTVIEMVTRNVPGASKTLSDKPGFSENEDYDADTGILEGIDWDYEEDTGLLSGGKEDGFCMDDDGTTNLSDRYPVSSVQHESKAALGVNARLTRKLNGEEVVINKPVFRIGKERSYVDYFIADNGAISRSHADIITRNGRVFIRDLNSKNRTYVNGSVLAPEVETELFHGDTVKLANEEFSFSSH